MLRLRFLGMKDFCVWGPTAPLIILSTACAYGFSAVGIDSFFYGTLAYAGFVAVASTSAFGLLLYYLMQIRRHLAAAALEREEWPPVTRKKRVGSFATEDIVALKDRSSWLTSVRSERTHSISTFSFSTPVSPPNLHNGLPSSESVPPVPGLPQEYKGTLSTPGIETGSCRREPPKRAPCGSEKSWLTDPSIEFSFSSIPPLSSTGSVHEQFEDVPLDHLETNHLSTPITPTAFAPSPRASRGQWCNRSLNGGVVQQPKAILGGHGPYIGDTEKATLHQSNIVADNLASWRVFGWFNSIWVPLVLALPYLAIQCVSSSVSTSAPLVLLTLSITLSSPILAVHVLCNMEPIPVIPPDLFAP